MTTHLGHLATRPPDQSDDAFLARLYASTRTDLLHLPVPTGVVSSIIRHQQQLQSASYATDFPNAEHLLLEHEGTPVGRAVIHQSREETRLVDLSIAPEARRRGHARAVLRALQERATHDAMSITLRVRKDNAAARALYLSHGFVATGEDEVSEQMCWTPSGA